MAVPGPKAADVPAPLPSDGTASADSGWQIYWPTYLWAAGANGSARTLPPFPRADIDLSFGDSLEAMKDLDAGLITSMFVNNGRFRMMGDVSWMRLSPEDQFKVGDTTAKLSTFLCSSAVGKDLAQSCYEARRAVRFGELVEIFLAEHVANLQPGTTVEYIRAETDVAIADFQRRANGKINTYAFVRQPTFLDDQPVTRMNRDTLYGSAVIDTEGGATITVPKADDGRYLSVLVIDNDHYAPAVSYSPGTYNLPHDMRFVALLYRVQLLDYADPKDVVAANALRDSFVVNASSTASFPALQ